MATMKFFLDSHSSLEEQTICTILRRHKLAEVCDLDLAHTDDNTLNAIVYRETGKSATNYFLPGATTSRIECESYQNEIVTISELNVTGVPVIRQVLGMFGYHLSSYDDAVAALSSGYVKGMLNVGIQAPKICEFLYRDRMVRSGNNYNAETSATSIISNNLTKMSTDAAARTFFWVNGRFIRPVEYSVIDYVAMMGRKSYMVFFCKAPAPTVATGPYVLNEAAIYTTASVGIVDKSRLLLPGYEILVGRDDRTKLIYIEVRRPDGVTPVTTEAFTRAFGFYQEFHNGTIEELKAMV